MKYTLFTPQCHHHHDTKEQCRMNSLVKHSFGGQRTFIWILMCQIMASNSEPFTFLFPSYR